jgi:[ribosomal protein S5]-alanine N-acetyltransferase
MQTIETNRLVLRDFDLSDLNDFFNYAKSAKVGPMAGWKPHESIDESEKILASFIESNDVWAIELKETHKVIGSIGLHIDSKRSNPNTRMLGYVLGEDYWGKGLMLEAVQALLNHGFNELNLDLISVYHFPFNTQSASVIRNAGFKYEGTLRQSTVHYDGRCLDSVLYSLTKDEYNAI